MENATRSRRVWERLEKWAKAGKKWLKYPLAFGWAFCFSAASLQQRPTALGACVVLAQSGGRALAAAAGAALGYTYFWQNAGMEGLAQVLAATVAALLPAPREAKLLRPALGAAIKAALGAAFLFQGPTVQAAGLGLYGINILMAFAMTWACQNVHLRQRGPADWGVALGAGLSLSQFWLGPWLRTGAIAAGLLLSRITLPSQLPAAAAYGLGLDLSGTFRIPMTAVLCLGAVTGLILPRHRGARLAGAALWCYPVMYITGQPDLTVPLGLLLGALPGVLPGFAHSPAPPAQAPPRPELTARLEDAARALEQMEQVLGWEPEPPDPVAELFDRAAERCCRDCGQYSACWVRGGAQTYRWLKAAAPEILHSREVGPDELPGAFLERCGRPIQFVEAVNESLFRQRLLDQQRARNREARRALEQQYAGLAAFLRDTAQGLDRPPPAPPKYQPEVGVQSRSRLGLGPCGDRGAHFSGPEGQYYVLLCDGMGTGNGAAKESDSAVRILTGLLRAGLPAGQALESFNNLCVLRQTPGFATADLLELHPDTGRAVLYKWGGAPSYLKQRHIAKKIGSGGPPPGLQLGSAGRGEVVHLSMQRGEVVVLATDGAAGEEFRQRLAACEPCSCAQLAAQLLGSAAGAEDDATVAAIRLRRSLSPAPACPVQ